MSYEVSKLKGKRPNVPSVPKGYSSSVKSPKGGPKVKSAPKK
jgi:hypothetical protein